MKLIDILKQNPARTWMWVAIILGCLLFMQTCARCTGHQNAAFAEKNHTETIDSLKVVNKALQDTILILKGNLQTCDRSYQDLQTENNHLRDALKQSQSKPVIIYRETKINQ